MNTLSYDIMKKYLNTIWTCSHEMTKDDIVNLVNECMAVVIEVERE